MASIFDVTDSSDSEDDVDYVPTAEIVLSGSSGDEDVSEEELATAKPKKAPKSQKEEVKKDVNPEIDSKELKVDPKQHAENVWKSFLSDVGSSPVTKSNTTTSTIGDETKSAAATIPAKIAAATIPAKIECKESKVPVKEVFEFAGETFTVDDSNLASHHCCDLSKANTSVSATASETKVMPKKRGGLDAVLGTLVNKKQKMTTLQKTQYDWKTFKKAEGIEEDLEKFNKGRGGFIERQRFLQRSDVRSFETEKVIRQSKKKK